MIINQLQPKMTINYNHIVELKLNIDVSQIFTEMKCNQTKELCRLYITLSHIVYRACGNQPNSVH